MGASNDAAATTAIAGGSIMIHAPKSSKTAVTTTGRNQVQEVPLASKLKLNASPNPSSNHFNLMLQGATNRTVNLRVVDLLGREVEVRRNIPANGTFRIGENYKTGV
jgi:hypothetical protein